MMSVTLAGDGPGLYEFIISIEYREPGEIAKENMKVTWAQITFPSLKISYDHHTLVNLAAKLLSHGRYYVPAKTPSEILKKFISLAPKQIASKITDIGGRFDSGIDLPTTGSA